MTGFNSRAFKVIPLRSVCVCVWWGGGGGGAGTTHPNTRGVGRNYSKDAFLPRQNVVHE